jgi:hypothetical protein
MPEQTYHGPIRTVLNIDHFSGELAGFLPAGTKLTPRAWLAATLVDRQPQFEAIVDRIDAMALSSGGGKLLIVVPGIRPDVHQSLVLRCGLAHFSENYDQENGWAYLGRVAWPRGAEGVLPILRKLGEALVFPKNARNQAAIEDEFAKLRQSVCFSHYLDAAWWNESEQRLVLDWVDYVCNGWPAPAVGRFVVAFLCLDSGADDHDPFEDLIVELRRRNKAGAPGSILVTKPLDLICATDVDDWVSEVGRYLKLPSVEATLLSATDELFSTPHQRLRFAEVYKGLYRRLAAVLAHGPIFTRED